MVRGNRKEAQLRLSQRLQKVDRGDYEPREAHKTFVELADAYTASHIDVQVRYATAKDYKTNLRLHFKPHFAETRIRAIRPKSVERWRKKLLEQGVGNRIVNKCHALLSAMLRYAEKHG